MRTRRSLAIALALALPAAARAQQPQPVIAPNDNLVAEGIRNFIFANQAIRTVVSALRENLRTLRASADLMSVEGRIASVEEIFRLQGADELCRAERKYVDRTHG